MRIGICDDELEIGTMLVRLVEERLEKLHEKATIELFQTGTILIDRAQEFDVVFLDIEMPDMDGFTIGR